MSENENMISDEAVEAALKAYLEHKSVRSPDNAKSAMRAALEAAALQILGDILPERGPYVFEAVGKHDQ